MREYSGLCGGAVRYEKLRRKSTATGASLTGDVTALLRDHVLRRTAAWKRLWITQSLIRDRRKQFASYLAALKLNLHAIADLVDAWNMTDELLGELTQIKRG